MKVAVVGCGGVGGIVAATLIRSGVDVTPVVPNATLAAALKKDGFRVWEFTGERWTVKPPLPSVASLNGRGPFDVAIMATPNPALETALRDTLPALTATAPIVLCQNGLPEDRARKLAGDRVL